MKYWLATAFAATILWIFPPDRYDFYPRCLVYAAFGLLCPGCGATRAAAALLHGHFMEALHWNALFVAAVLIAAPFGLARWGRGDREWPKPPRWMAASGVVLVVLFGIVRNIVL